MYCVYDIETLKGMFLYVSKDLQTGNKFIFRIDRYQNDLQLFVDHLQERRFTYFVSFNGLSFDSQVIQYILTNYHKWLRLPGEKIAAIIYQFAQDRIDDARYNLPIPFKETELWALQVDLFRIHHFDNENRRCSLKWLEYSMDFPNVEEMPIDHWRTELSDQEIDEIIFYCVNDVLATEHLYLITRGQTDLEEYAGKDKIQDRLDIIEEYGLPAAAMNWSDVRIGDELNLLAYRKLTGLTVFQVKDLRKNRKPTPAFTFGDCIPCYIAFKTEALQQFYQKVSAEKVRLRDKDQEYKITIGASEYTIKKGGIHSNEKSRMVVTGAGELIIDADVGSQYPNAIVKRGLFSSHLGGKWLINYKRTISRRLEYKALSQDMSLSVAERRKYKGLAEFLKLALNGGGFGKTNEPSNWQYDPFVHFSCNIGNQFEILMLIESLELAGISVISANTDGIVSHLSKEKEQEYYRICREWEVIVGNAEMGKLEYTYYSKLVQTSVSHYLAVKPDGQVKKKGSFATSGELHKNKSRRIIPISLEKYFLHGTPVQETIRNHDNIFDFSIGVKSTRDYHFEAINTKTGAKRRYHRVLRYYVSAEGEKLMKVHSDITRAAKKSGQQCEAGHWLSTVINQCAHSSTLGVDINFDYYIRKCQEIISSVENAVPVKKKKGAKISPQQLSIF
jgi:hypothetical protein